MTKNQPPKPTHLFFAPLWNCRLIRLPISNFLPNILYSLRGERGMVGMKWVNDTDVIYCRKFGDSPFSLRPCGDSETKFGSRVRRDVALVTDHVRILCERKICELGGPKEMITAVTMLPTLFAHLFCPPNLHCTHRRVRSILMLQTASKPVHALLVQN